MMKHISIYTFRIIFLSLLFVSPLVLTSYDDTRNFEISKNLDIFYSVFQEINTHYVDQIDPGELMSYAIDKMLESLDPYTKYIPESDVERFQMMTKGEYGGIGAMIGKRDSVMMISEIFEGYPAHKAGLLPGDKIVTIDNRSIIGKNRDEIHELLQGQPGTTIILGIQRGNSKTINTYSVKRETINLKSVPYYNMLDNNIGYVKLNQFTQNCAVEVKNACNDLRSKGAKSLILDLRDNPGGLLMEAIQITNLFVEENKKIVYTKGKNKIAESTFYTKEQPWDTKIPLVILVNQFSASASEIVSGALQDLDRAVVIGNQTFGKGLVQTRKELAHNSLLKVTTSKYYIPSGRCIQKMDYSQQKYRGKGVVIADSLHSVFYTQNNRPVEDGGGVIPDVYVKIDTNKQLTAMLKNTYMFDDFVNSTYSYADSSKYRIQSFTVTESMFNSFKKYTAEQQFVYKSQSETLLNSVITQLSKDNIDAQHEIALLQKKIRALQDELFVSEKQSIEQELALYIMQRMYFERGKIQYQTLHDEYINQAKQMLLNPKEYNNILQGFSGVHKKK